MSFPQTPTATSSPTAMLRKNFSKASIATDTSKTTDADSRFHTGTATIDVASTIATTEVANDLSPTDHITEAGSVDLPRQLKTVANGLGCSVEELSERSEAGQALRRKYLKGKKILFVCCGIDEVDSKEFIFQRAKDIYGIESYLLEDGTNSLALRMEKHGLLAEFIKCDMTPRPGLVDDAIASIILVQKKIGSFDGVCTFWDDAVGLCVRVCRALGTTMDVVEAVDIAHNKHATRRLLVAAGIPTPRNYLIKNESDLKEAAKLVGFPAIVKPMYGAASMGVQYIENEEELQEKYIKTRTLLEEFYEEGELMGLTFEDTDGEEEKATKSGEDLTYAIMEQYLDGDEVDVDLVLAHGDVVYSTVTDDWPQVQPWFADNGNNCPSVLPEYKQVELIDMAVQVVKAMGFSSGVFHVELKYTSEGARLIEVNPRMGGGPNWAMHCRAFGIDLIEEHLFSSVGLPCNPPVPSKPLHCTSCGEKFFDESCVATKRLFECVEELGKKEDVLEASVLVELGARIMGANDGFPSRVVRYIVEKRTPFEAAKYAEALLKATEA